MTNVQSSFCLIKLIESNIKGETIVTRKKYDWISIKAEYVHSGVHIPLAELSERYHIPMRTVSRHSIDEKWVEERQSVIDETARKTRDLAISKKSKENLSQLDKAESAFDGLVMAITAINKRIEKADFSDKVGKVEITKLMERQASLNTALDKIGRLTQLLKGNADQRIGVDLASLLSTDQDSDSE